MGYDKKEIRKNITIDDLFQLLTEWGGEPEYTNFGLISTTICHNRPGQGSRKLYYYTNSDLFHCFTGCDESFDIFELTIKIMKIQNGQVFDLNDAVRYIAFRLGISGYTYEEDGTKLQDWEYFEQYSRIKTIEEKQSKVEIVLKDYDPIILQRLNYNVRIEPWLKDNISQEVIEKAEIGYYPSACQITIPHFDENDRFIGLRGRTLGREEAERFGKYRPCYINGIQYSHPLGLNLYGLNWSKGNIQKLGKAIVVESEKSVLQYASYFGFENNICVACCGSSLSAYQIDKLLTCGANEIIIGFDRQFQEIGDDEFKHLTNHLIKINQRVKNYATVSFMFDKNMITGYKSSPTDEGKDKFITLFNERIYLQ